MSKEELNKILLNPDYAESLGVKVYVEVKDNGEKYAILNNGEEETRLKNKTKMKHIEDVPWMICDEGDCKLLCLCRYR